MKLCRDRFIHPAVLETVAPGSLFTAEVAQQLRLLIKFLTMKKIILGALVCAAVAGVVYYLNDPEKFSDTIDDLKQKADDALGKAKSGLASAERNVRNAVS